MQASLGNENSFGKWVNTCLVYPNFSNSIMILALEKKKKKKERKKVQLYINLTVFLTWANAVSSLTFSSTQNP